MTERSPRLQVSILIEDRLSKKAILRSVLLTPQQLDAYKANVFIAAARTLTASLITQQDFLDFLEAADPLWKNILLEIPEGKRGVSQADDMLALRYCDREEIGMFNEAFHDQCFKKFGNGKARSIEQSPYMLAEIDLVKWNSPHGQLLVVATGDPENIDKLVIHQTLTVVVDTKTGTEISEALLTGKLALPAEGQVYGRFTLDWLKQQGWVSDIARAGTVREKAKAEARRLRDEKQAKIEADKPKIPTTTVKVAAGAR
jgi:hypothetical protein